MKKKLMSAALDIVFSTVVYFLFLNKLLLWASNNAYLRTHFPALFSWGVTILMQAAALAAYFLYIRFLADASPKDYFLAGVPKLRFFLFGILAAILYAFVALLLLPGKWTVQIGEPALLSVLSAVWRSAKSYVFNGQFFYPVLFGGMYFGALVRRKVKLSTALLVVGILVAVLSYEGIQSVTDVTHLLFWGVQAAAFGMIALYTKSVWSAVLFDLPFRIMMDHYVFQLFPGYRVPHPDDANILFFHQANNTNVFANHLIIGRYGMEHAITVLMALFYLALIVCLYIKIKKNGY